MEKLILWFSLLAAAAFLILKRRVLGDNIANAVDGARKAFKQRVNPPPKPRGRTNPQNYTGDKSWWNDIVNFQPSQFDDNSIPAGSGYEMMKEAVIRKLDEACTLYGVDMWVSSGYRSPAKNKAVNGVPNSPHMLGVAVDTSYNNESETKRAFGCFLEAGIRRIGVYRSLTRPGGWFIHIDTKPGRALWFSNKYPKNGKPLSQSEMDYFTNVFKNYK